jgi:hypothetical protein
MALLRSLSASRRSCLILRSFRLTEGKVGRRTRCVRSAPISPSAARAAALNIVGQFPRRGPGQSQHPRWHCPSLARNLKIMPDELAPQSHGSPYRRGLRSRLERLGRSSLRERQDQPSSGAKIMKRLAVPWLVIATDRPPRFHRVRHPRLADELL